MKKLYASETRRLRIIRISIYWK